MNSILTVTSAATKTALTTLETFRTMMQITTADTDVQITQEIDRATAAIETYCGRVFRRQTYSEQFRGVHCLSELMLNRFPVVSITSVTVDGTALDPADFEVNEENGFVYRLSSDTPISWWGDKIVVVYVAGYALPGESGRTLPHDIEDACLEQVKSKWFSGTRDPLIKRERVDSVGETEFWVGAIGENAALAPQVIDRLTPYVSFSL